MNRRVSAQPKLTAKSVPSAHRNILQRKSVCDGNDRLTECRATPQSRNGRTLEIPPIVSEVLNSAGQPLDAETRSLMEPRFGHNFGNVRVHTDARAAESARALSALAYTVGQDVVFAESRYQLKTAEGRELLAHELTHTVQQHSLSSKASLDQLIRVEPSDTSFEQAANERATSIENRSGNIAPVQQIALQRQPAPSSQVEKPAERTFAADKYKRTWRHYARSEALKDAERIRKKGKLSAEDRAAVNAKLEFFEGAAWDVYVQLIKPALVEVSQEEIEMPGAYGDVLDAIVRIMEYAPVSSRESPIDKNPLPEDSRSSPAYYQKRNVTRDEDVKLLWDWFKIANTWSQTTTSYRSPDPNFVVSGAVGRKQIAEAVRKTTPIVDVVRAAGGGDLVARYEAMVGTFKRAAEFKASRESEVATEEQVHNTPWTQIMQEWDARKNDFIAVASKPNHLDGHQLFAIWQRYWSEQYHDAWVADDRMRDKLWEEDAVKFANGMYDFEHNSMRDALGPEYRKVRDHFDTVAFLFSMPGEKMLAWLETMVDVAGHHYTFQDVNDHAREWAEANANWGFIGQAALGMVGGLQEPAVEPVPATPKPIGFELPATTAELESTASLETPGMIRPSRPVAGFGRDIEPAPEAVPAPDQYQMTQMPGARIVQGNQPAVGNLKPAFENQGAAPPSTPSPRVVGFRPPKDVVETPGFIEAETGPREYVKREYLGDRGAAGQQQSRYHVNVNLDERGMMDSDFVLRGGGRRSGALSGKDEFLAAKQHFEQQNGAGAVKGAYGRWGGGDNLDLFNTRYQVARNKGFSHDEAMIQAARETKTGEWAKAAGFNNVNITRQEGSPGAYTNVEVEFTK